MSTQVQPTEDTAHLSARASHWIKSVFKRIVTPRPEPTVEDIRACWSVINETRSAVAKLTESLCPQFGFSGHSGSCVRGTLKTIEGHKSGNAFRITYSEGGGEAEPEWTFELSYDPLASKKRPVRLSCNNRKYADYPLDVSVDTLKARFASILRMFPNFSDPLMARALITEFEKPGSTTAAPGAKAAAPI
ncbi:MAG: hypothetical protein KDJ49_06885 [Alphaproteobacteria bacterium]|nr:hypothetical protein [Alphaproteobacteria bacterium]USO07462.1 MAG: hypothetical protein H6866_08620 [Rhodospirillales bacterium]